MSCFNPVTAWQPDEGGQLVFNEIKNAREIKVPCNNCIGCRIQRSGDWMMRIVHEAQKYKENCFITLTYDSDKIPGTHPCNTHGTFYKKDFTNFMKYLRKSIYPKKVKFYMVGEYGDATNRPHYHAVIFNHNFNDRYFIGTSDSGHDLFSSHTLEKLWNKGFVQVADVTPDLAAYIARYVLKKVVGNATDVIDPITGLKPYERYNSYTGEIVEVWPEYSTMSRGGRSGRGIGYDWIRNYSSDVYPKDYTHISSSPRKPPRYYDEKIKEIDPDLIEQVKENRKILAMKLYGDNTPERLEQRKKVALAKSKLLKRSL